MRTAPLAYQPTSRPLARTPAIASFETALADAVRQIRCSAYVATRKDRQLLDDFQRGRGIVRITRLADISRTCTDPGDATALAECFRGHALSGHRGLAVTEALRIEQRFDGAEDEAVYEFLSNRCPATRARAIEALRRAAETSEAAVEALERSAAT